MQLAMGISLLVFFALMVGISLWASKRIHTGEDFIVAGRHLPGIMTTATIMATWYAAETILVTADIVKTDGIHVTVLEPIGIGLCLIIAGWFFARRLWELKLLTLADVVGSAFGKTAEKLQAFVSFSYIGWVAVQLIGLAGVFAVYFDISVATGIVILAVILTLYTLVGGMWSVAMTDIVQLSLLLIGVVFLTIRVLVELGGSPLAGLAALFDQVDRQLLEFVPTGSREALHEWLGYIVIGLFANAATQDLIQRMFSARSARVAEVSCIAAGVLYMVFGIFPVLLGLAGNVLLADDATQGIIPSLAEIMFSPTLAIIFALTLTAAVTSSVDSGLLAPASVLARNVIAPFVGDRISLVTLTRICVVIIALVACSVALSGTHAFEIIQGTYSLTLPSFIVLGAALYHRNARHLPGVLTLTVGLVLWAYEIGSNFAAGGADAEVLSPGFPIILFFGCIAVYVISHRLVIWNESRKSTVAS